MINIKTKNAFLIQILVQNYLEHEFEYINELVNLYNEVINDIDGFNFILFNNPFICKKLQSINPSNTSP